MPVGGIQQQSTSNMTCTCQRVSYTEGLGVGEKVVTENKSFLSMNLETG